MPSSPVLTRPFGHTLSKSQASATESAMAEFDDILSDNMSPVELTAELEVATIRAIASVKRAKITEMSQCPIVHVVSRELIACECLFE